MRSLPWFGVALLFLLPYRSNALGIRIADQDPFATARGNAFAATADNPSAIYYNPAGITQLEGHQVGASIYAISMSSEFTALAGSSVDTKDEIQAVPHFYYTFMPESWPVAFGLGIYSPYGLGLEWPNDGPFRLLATEGRIAHFSINPVAAWEIVPGLSIAAGPTFNYSETTLKRGIGFFPGDEFKFEGDGWDAGFNAGVRWQPHPMFAFGVTYRSAGSIDYEGDVSTSPSPPFPAAQPASAELDFPQHVIAGVSFRPSTNWNFEVNIDWTDWDALNTVVLQQAAGDLDLPFNWDSSFFYEFGATYFTGGGWRISAGYIFSENSVPEESFSPTVPDSDRHIVSAGIGRSYEHWRWDAAYQFAYGPSRDVRGTTFGLADGSYEFTSHALNLSIGYAF